MKIVEKIKKFATKENWETIDVCLMCTALALSVYGVYVAGCKRGSAAALNGLFYVDPLKTAELVDELKASRQIRK